MRPREAREVGKSHVVKGEVSSLTGWECVLTSVAV